MSSIGRLDGFGIGKESSYGGGATPAHWIPTDSLEFKDNVPKIDDTAARGRIEDAANSEIASKSGEITAEGPVPSKGIGMLLLGAFGSVSTSGTDPYTHTFSILNTNSPESFALTPGSGGQRSVQGDFAGQIVDSLEISLSAEEFLRFAVKFMGKIGDGSTSASESLATEDQWTSQYAAFKIADDLSGLDAATAFNVRMAKIAIQKNAELRFNTGSLDPASAKNKQLQISGEFEIEFPDNTYRALFAADTKKAIRFEFENTAVDLGGGVHPKLTIDVAKASLRDWGPSGGNDDILTQTFTFKGFYSQSDGKSIEAELINDQASY